jgi:hypothetical protein
MDIHLGAQVEGTDGRVGELTRVVVDSRNEILTHLVVHGQGVLGVERLVPVDDVVDATAGSVAREHAGRTSRACHLSIVRSNTRHPVSATRTWTRSAAITKSSLTRTHS